MGHLIFLLLHFLALIFGMVLLFITIPLHLIYCAASSKPAPDPNRPNWRTHVICPTCRELVRSEAHICVHCRQGLVPQEIKPWWVLDGKSDVGIEARDRRGR